MQDTYSSCMWWPKWGEKGFDCLRRLLMLSACAGLPSELKRAEQTAIYQHKRTAKGEMKIFPSLTRSLWIQAVFIGGILSDLRRLPYSRSQASLCSSWQKRWEGNSRERWEIKGKVWSEVLHLLNWLKFTICVDLCWEPRDLHVTVNHLWNTQICV